MEQSEKLDLETNADLLKWLLKGVRLSGDVIPELSVPVVQRLPVILAVLTAYSLRQRPSGTVTVRWPEIGNGNLRKNGVMDLSHAISTLETAIGDPQGLPEDVFLFVSRVTPLMNVDLLIKDDGGRALLTWRNDELSGSGWHVPAGIIRPEETAADRIRACARAELGAEVAFEPAPVLLHEGTLEHFTSMLYRHKLLALPDSNHEGLSNPPARGEWRWHQSCRRDFLSAQAHYALFI